MSAIARPTASEKTESSSERAVSITALSTGKSGTELSFLASGEMAAALL
jgi:hypothetical protein